VFVMEVAQVRAESQVGFAGWGGQFRIVKSVYSSCGVSRCV
jgi:hypothetical protein